MWAYQHTFRLTVEAGIRAALEAIGFFGDPAIVLVGFQVAGEHDFDICIEPEVGPYRPSDFKKVRERAAHLYEQHPDRNVFHSDARAEASFHKGLRNWMRAQAIEETLADLPGGQDRAFFVHGAVKLDDYLVHIVLGVDKEILRQVPQITTKLRGRLRIHRSLVHAVIDEALSFAAQELRIRNLGVDLGLGHHELARKAAGLMVATTLYCAGTDANVYDGHRLMSDLSALPYEGRSGVGRVVFARRGHSAVDVKLKLGQSASIRNIAAARKLLEVSGPGVDLLSDGENVYGLGTLRPDYDAASETAFVVDITGRGSWELSHAGRALLAFRNGTPHLPSRVLNESYLHDLVDRFFFPDADVGALLEAAKAAGKHKHGAMLVISGDARREAARLFPQAWSVEPVRLTPELLTQLTNMDGAILVDPQGLCHAIGVILDGIAQGEGDPARGSRFNNAVRYLGGQTPPTIVVVYSSDGGVTILPQLHSRISKSHVVGIVEQYLAVASASPRNLRDVHQTWEKVKAVRFYLSRGQCDMLNQARASVDDWAQQDSSITIWPVETDLEPDPKMNDSYWL
ncbi:diadenylate cyclase [Actinomadura decatromicini]|uniref:DAC domain-containing protein n=1 Tax=Actinomadura decatromicini TaxID=2604572 RepID=A0A5D3F9I1_9ACTN|nr:diadenylate cyclase [Actinomadura decatromicini]TYK44564.1 hypothetical protein FXF68_34460 [Actinomadura decatromicini]